LPKKRRRAKIPAPRWEEHRGGAIGARLLGKSFQFYGLIVVVVLAAVALGVVGYAFWKDEADRRGRPGSTAIQVEDRYYRLDYFSRRLSMFIDQVGGLNSDAAQYTTAIPAVAETLIQEEIVRRFAENLEATDDEIKAEIATRLGITVEDESFDTVFEQELSRSGFTEEEYRDMIKASVLQDKLLTRFTDQLPETAESVRYRQILVSSQEEADDIIAEIEGGADFAALAVERSLDTATKPAGGEVGWVPRGVNLSTEDLIFGTEVGDLTSVPVASGVLVIEVEEKADAREIEEEQRAPLAGRALQDWVEGQRDEVNIVNNMDLTDGDGDKIAWVIQRVYTS
jgi:parvulin-like peptidyl-prolyl isomerase